MSAKPGWRTVLTLLTLLGLLATSVKAQNLLYVEYGDKSCVVLGADGDRPIIEVGGKRVDVRGTKFALKPVKEYVPLFIAVRNLEVRSTYATVGGGGSEINNDLHFNASFEAGYRLDDVLLLLDLTTAEGGRTFFLYGIGRLDPHEASPVHLTVPVAGPLGPGHFQFHLFVGGAEALHSGIPAFDRELVLDRMIARRVAKLPDGGPQPFLGPVPEYPPALRKGNVAGQAVVSLWIRTTGSVRDPVVKSATDPAFGDSALAAARLWRFLPRVKAGRPVETKVEMPFVFGPTGEPAAKS